MAHTHATRSRAGRHVRHHPRPFVWGGCRRRWTSMYMCLSSTDEPFPTVRKVSNQGRGGARPLSPRFLHWARRVLAFYLPTEAHAGCQLFSQRSPRKSILYIGGRRVGTADAHERTNGMSRSYALAALSLLSACVATHAETLDARHADAWHRVYQASLTHSQPKVRRPALRACVCGRAAARAPMPSRRPNGHTVRMQTALAATASVSWHV